MIFKNQNAYLVETRRFVPVRSFLIVSTLVLEQFLLGAGAVCCVLRLNIDVC